MKKLIFVITVIFFALRMQSQTINIAAAGNLRFVLDEIKSDYISANPNIKIYINYGSSGALLQQITNGADFDIYMAADKLFPDKLAAKGFVSGKVITYAFGKLILWSNTVDVSKGISIILDNSVKRIAIAKPDIAPYGERAIQCLNYYHLFEDVKDKIVYADNIAQTAQFTQTGNAEIGFIALALALTPEMKGNYYILDTKSYSPVEQAMALLNNAKNKNEAKSFMDYIMSVKCKTIFEKYGYIVPKNE